MKIYATMASLLLLTGCYLSDKHYNDIANIDTNLGELRASDQQMEQEIRSLKAALGQMDVSLKEEVATENVVIQQVSPASIQVTMQQKLLFDIGSIAISSTGRQALARLAEGLRKSPDNSRIRIVGHTDAWPVGETLRARFTDNWELSAARAAAVARVLVWGEDIPETRIQVEGRAHTKPVAKNDSAKGRAKNRRIEVFVETAN